MTLVCDKKDDGTVVIKVTVMLNVQDELSTPEGHSNSIHCGICGGAEHDHIICPENGISAHSN